MVAVQRESRDGGLKLGVRQLGALLRRQWLIKRRSPLATVFEVLAPVILMSCLVLGANLSTVTDYPREIYADKGLIATNSSTWKFIKDLVELESRELCAAAGPNLTAADVTSLAASMAGAANATANSTNGTGDNASDVQPSLSPPPPADATTEGLSLLARLASNPGAANAAAETQAFLVSRLGLQETITLESALFAAAESPTDSDAVLGLVRELQRQSAEGVDLGIGGRVPAGCLSFSHRIVSRLFREQRTV